jgi:hypothetical protein
MFCKLCNLYSFVSSDRIVCYQISKTQKNTLQNHVVFGPANPIALFSILANEERMNDKLKTKDFDCKPQGDHAPCPHFKMVMPHVLTKGGHAPCAYPKVVMSHVLPLSGQKLKQLSK